MSNRNKYVDRFIDAFERTVEFGRPVHGSPLAAPQLRTTSPAEADGSSSAVKGPSPR